MAKTKTEEELKESVQTIPDEIMYLPEGTIPKQMEEFKKALDKENKNNSPQLLSTAEIRESLEETRDNLKKVNALPGKIRIDKGSGFNKGDDMIKTSKILGLIMGKKKNKSKKVIKVIDKDQVLQASIYEDTHLKAHLKKFHLFHYVFKYRLFVPIILIIRRVVGKKILEKPVPERRWNANIKIFDESFDQTCKDWFSMRINRRNKFGDKAKWQEHSGVKILQTMKQIIIQGALMDTAYREFLNMFSHNMTRNMINYYSQEPGKAAIEIMYNSGDAYDAHWFALQARMNNEVRLELLKTIKGKVGSMNEKKKEEIVKTMKRKDGSMANNGVPRQTSRNILQPKPTKDKIRRRV